MVDRAAFAAMARRPEDYIDLAAAALLLARIQEPVPEPQRYLEMLDRLAAQFRLSLPLGAGPHETMARLGHFLGHELGFVGNLHQYDDPRNSCLNTVLDRRVGIPISLSVVYLEIGWRLGLPLAGVGMPGHFLIKHTGDGHEIIADPFDRGRLLSAEDCAKRLAQVVGYPAALEPHYLAAVTRKQILTRMLTNLKLFYLRGGDFIRGLETIEHLLLISPWALDEIRDRGLTRAQLGRRDQAIEDLETYLRYSSDAPDAVDIERRLRRLRWSPGEGE